MIQNIIIKNLEIKCSDVHFQENIQVRHLLKMLNKQILLNNDCGIVKKPQGV